MGSKRLWAGLLAQAGVFACGAVAILAWRAALPANAVLLALIGTAAAFWVASRAAGSAGDSAPAPAPTPENLERERARRTLQAFLDQAPTPLVTWRPGGPTTAVNRAARRLFRTDDVVTGPAGEAEPPSKDRPTRRTVRLTSDGVARTYALSVADVAGAGGALPPSPTSKPDSSGRGRRLARASAGPEPRDHELADAAGLLAQTTAEVLAEGPAGGPARGAQFGGGGSRGAPRG